MSFDEKVEKYYPSWQYVDLTRVGYIVQRTYFLRAIIKAHQSELNKELETILAIAEGGGSHDFLLKHLRGAIKELTNGEQPSSSKPSKEEE